MTSDGMFTVRDAVGKGAEFFKRKGIESARLDAELLVGAAVGMDRLHIYLNLDRPLNDAERDRARELILRRSTREPVAYILGKREFRSRDFDVNPAVLIPRPETEMLVDICLERLAIRFAEADSAYRLLEFGAGSGAIGVSIAAEAPKSQIVATEISAAAAEVARRNAQRHGVAERIEIRVQSDFAGITGPFHAIISNPPYIAETEASSLPVDVARFEPREALFAGPDGTDAIRFLLSSEPALLYASGFLLIEIDHGQMPLVRDMAQQYGMELHEALHDYAGVERFALLSRRSAGL